LGTHLYRKLSPSVGGSTPNRDAGMRVCVIAMAQRLRSRPMGRTTASSGTQDNSAYVPTDPSSRGPLVLYAYERTNVANELYNSSPAGSRDRTGTEIYGADGRQWEGIRPDRYGVGHLWVTAAVIEPCSFRETPTFPAHLGIKSAGRGLTGQRVLVPSATASTQTRKFVRNPALKEEPLQWPSLGSTAHRD
jgi:hypothetical protein